MLTGRRLPAWLAAALSGVLWVPSAVWAIGAVCNPAGDALARAQCTIDAAGQTGAGTPGTWTPTQVPGFVTDTPPETGYFDTSGNPAALDAAAAAAAQSPQADDLRNKRDQAAGWDLSQSPPVETARQVAQQPAIDPDLGRTCTTQTTCVSWQQVPSGGGVCRTPGTSHVTCLRTWAPSLTAAACAVPPNGTPPVHTEQLSDGCASYQALAASGQATQQSVTCVDSAPRTLTCAEPTGVSIGAGGSWGGSHDHSPGMSQAWYQVNTVTWSPNGAGGYTLTFRFSGNAVGENKYGCTNASGVAGSVWVSEGGSASMTGRPPFCNSKCACWGNGMTFVLGTSTWTGTTFQIPFTFRWEAHAYSVTIMGGLTAASYTVSPQSGCWREEQTWLYATQIPDTCRSYREQGCTQTGSVCGQTDAYGNCEYYNNEYTCYGSTCAAEQTVQVCATCGDPQGLVPFCLDDATPPDQSLAKTAAWLQVLQNAQDQWDPNSLTIFRGDRVQCVHGTGFGNLAIDNCCADPPQGGSCTQTEWDAYAARRDKRAHYVGEYCSNWVNLLVGKICVERTQVWCAFPTSFARIVHEQGRPALPRGWGTAESPDCGPFTIQEFQQLPWDGMDFSEVYDQLTITNDQAGLAQSAQQATSQATGR